MRQEEPWSNEESWERLVNGPLSPQQLAELVAACEREPQLWKRCALALLEEQTLRHEIQAMAREHLGVGQSPLAELVAARSGRAMPASMGGSKPATAQAAAALPCPEPTQVVPSQAFKTTASTARAGLWNGLALAASLLVMFGIGWQASQRFGWSGSINTQSRPNAELVAQDAAERELAAPVPFNSNSSSGNMWVRDGGSQVAIDPATIEQVNAETLARTIQVGDENDLEPEYQQLRRRGYEVQAQEGFVPIWLSDGTPAVVPYQQIKVRPKSSGRTY